MPSAFSIIVRLAWDLAQWCGLVLRPRKSLEAENLFLRRQLALYRERGVRPRRVDAATRVTLAFFHAGSIGVRHWLLCDPRR